MTQCAVNSNATITAKTPFDDHEKLFSSALSYVEKLYLEGRITTTSTYTLKETLKTLQSLALLKNTYAELAQEHFHSDEELQHQQDLLEKIGEHQAFLQNIHPSIIDWLLERKKTKKPTKQSIKSFPQTERNSVYILVPHPQTELDLPTK